MFRGTTISTTSTPTLITILLVIRGYRARVSATHREFDIDEYDACIT